MTDKENLNISSSEKDLASESEVQRVAKLIADIKKSSGRQSHEEEVPEKITTIDIEPLEIQAAPNTEPVSKSLHVALQFEELYPQIKRDIDSLVEKELDRIKISKALPKGRLLSPIELEIMSQFDQIISRADSSESEIDIHTILSKADIEKVNDLFLLLEEELTSKTKKLKLNQIQLSNTTILNREDLQEVFEELGEKVIEAESSAKKEQVVPSEEIPFPTFVNILFAFLFDVLVISGLDIFIVTEYKDLALSPKMLVPIISNQWVLFIPIFFSLWALIQSASLILTQGALGQSLMSIVVATKDNLTPRIPTLLSRLSLHILNFITLGLYSNFVVRRFLARDQNGFYCPISKTKLTYRGFTKDL